jgi:hypothetical protein
LGTGDTKDVLIPTFVPLPGEVLQGSGGWMHTAFLVREHTEEKNSNVPVPATSEMGLFGMLPYDILNLLLLSLDVISLCRVSVLNSTFKSLCERDFIWISLVRNHSRFFYFLY